MTAIYVEEVRPKNLAFAAKELQPYVKTFPAGYYENLFRLRGLPYPPLNAKYRPQYFGVLTNDIVYKRLAPGLLAELKKENAKAEKIPATSKAYHGNRPSKTTRASGIRSNGYAIEQRISRLH